MRFNPSRLAEFDGSYRFLKPPSDSPAAQRDPAVATRVSEMLSAIERGGMDAVLKYARELDGWQRPEVEIGAAELARTGDGLPEDVRAALELGHERTSDFARRQRAHLVDFEAELAPGLIAGQRYVPVQRVGAYLPAGRFPLLAGAFMTVGVAKAAGVPSVLACTPPGREGNADPAVLYGAHLSGADRAYVLGGVQALAAMAFGLLGEYPVDMLVGAGNAYVAEAKRQLFGKVAIDLPAGPSEVAVLADDTADARLVAADLLGQAEHGTESPAALITTSPRLGEAVVAEVDRQLETLATRDVAGPAWRDHGSVTWAKDAATAIALMDELAPEHLEIQTADDEMYLAGLHNYGSVFLGPWSTVAYSDKGMAGTNHVLPTAGGAKHSAGLSVSRFLKPLTYQRVSRAGTEQLAGAVESISAYEGMAAHGATATLRRQALREGDQS
ncbi:histidinol dehydrogenase [Streptomyces tsukubensis]|uniref:Histidinol dehydrogenase n=1 Tax=Streptomyces tsukubensis TaxID=83656 RepID=A0A1V4AE52_9ACTN|nr:histidinol dehydrogenase [Streptomyces tsukubensis]OON81868.1 histidinol dehydrogenase [Streptomyces tsukubensis]QFR96657.1 histidinol dehydrogenase [Streptomyces tsukubensis]